MKAHAITDTGKKRKINEDSFHCDPEKGIFIVADGMGGHLAGEEASRIAVKTISKFFSNSSHNIEQIIEKSINTSNSIIFSKSEIDSKYKGMGTTVTICIFKNNSIFVGHVGDSRLYRFRKHELEMLTEDHSKVWEFYKMGIISKEEIRTHPYKSIITRGVGIKNEVSSDIFIINDVMPEDVYLICSDGLTDMVQDNTIREVLDQNDSSIKDRLQYLVGLANQYGGKDNITAILFELEKSDLIGKKFEKDKNNKYCVFYNKSINFTIRSEIKYL